MIRATTIMLVAIALIVCACTRSASDEPGAKFVGKWSRIGDPNDRMEISRNGSQFLVSLRNSRERVGAIYKDGSLEISGVIGPIRLTYVESSGTLIMPDFNGPKEYVRGTGTEAVVAEDIVGPKPQYGPDGMLENADRVLSGKDSSFTGFEIKNLPGFSGPNIMTRKSCRASVPPSSLSSATIVISNMVLEGLDISMEVNGLRNNLNDLVMAIDKTTAATGNSVNHRKGSDFVIDTLLIKGTHVHISGIVKMDLNLPDLEIKDPCIPNKQGMRFDDLTGIIIIHLSKQILDNPAVPNSVKDSMGGAKKVVDNLSNKMQPNIKVSVPDMKDMKLPDTNGVRDAGKNLQNLNPFDKKDTK